MSEKPPPSLVGSGGSSFFARIRRVIPRVIAKVRMKPTNAHRAAERPVETKTSWYHSTRRPDPARRLTDEQSLPASGWIRQRSPSHRHRNDRRGRNQDQHG